MYILYTYFSAYSLFLFPWVSSQNVRHCPSLGLESQEGQDHLEKNLWAVLMNPKTRTWLWACFSSVWVSFVVFEVVCSKFFRGVENSSPEMCLESCTNSHTTGSVFDSCWGILFNRMTANELLPTTGATSATKALDRLSIVRQQEVLTQSLMLLLVGPVTSYKWGYNSIYMGL